MTNIEILILGLIFGLVIVATIKSLYKPNPLEIMAIMKLGRLHTFIMNVEGKTIVLKGDDKWNIIDIDTSHKRRSGVLGTNIYFFPWLIFTSYKFDLSYTKKIKKEEIKDGDIILKEITDPVTKKSVDVIVLRKRTSDHLLYRQGYPMVTPSLNTEGLTANVNVMTNPVLEIQNPAKALFGIPDWLGASMNILGAAVRGIVANTSITELNKLKSEGETGGFNTRMKALTNIDNLENPGLGNIGIELFKDSFEDFDPADEATKKLMDAFINVLVIEEEAKANVKKSEGDAKVKLTLANAEAESFGMIAKTKVEWAKKNLVDTGLAKVDADGAIIELVPDANVKASTDAIKALSGLKGTLILGGDQVKSMLTINPATK